MDTDTAWELWGARDPYFGVLTNPKYRAVALTPEAKEEFFAIGRQHVEHVLEVFRRHIDPSFEPQRVLDFGCGVGRLVIPFAERAAEVVGLDIAPSMLAEARQNCEARGITNVSLRMSDDTLSSADGNFDLVHSCLVLQHIEVARGRDLFRRLVQNISPGGAGIIHLTFAWDFYAQTFGQVPPPVPPPRPSRLSLVKRRLWLWFQPFKQATKPIAPQPTAENSDPEMQMNYYNLSELMFILQTAGVTRVHTEITNHGGALGAVLFFRVPD